MLKIDSVPGYELQEEVLKGAYRHWHKIGNSLPLSICSLHTECWHFEETLFELKLS